VKKLWYFLFCAIAAGAILQSAATAGTVLGVTGKKCYSRSNDGGQLNVFGDWIETVDNVSTNAPGVTISIGQKLNGAQDQSGPFPGRGMITLNFSINNATAGNKTITLSGGFFGSGSTTITIEDLPSVSSVDIPTPSDPFGDITLTFHGSGLQSAQDPASGSIVNDNLVPFITVGGNASVTSVRVLSSSSSAMTARIFFSALVQDVSVDLHFRSNDPCTPLFNAGRGLDQRVRVKSSNVKNFVASVTFPNGNSFTKNSIGTINLNLLFPAPGGSSSGTTASLKGVTVINVGNIGGSLVNRNALLAQLAANALDNSQVFIQFVPSNIFASVPGGTQLNAQGLTTVKANPGEDIIPITFKVADCIGGQPGQANTVTIKTWMHSTNTNLPPDFIQQNFTVVCTP